LLLALIIKGLADWLLSFPNYHNTWNSSMECPKNSSPIRKIKKPLASFGRPTKTSSSYLGKKFSGIKFCSPNKNFLWLVFDKKTS